MKIDVEAAASYWTPEGRPTMPVLRILPFARSTRARRPRPLLHRVRRASVHWRGGRPSHLSTEMLCGMSFIEAHLSDEPSAPLCRRCFGFPPRPGEGPLA